MWKVLPLMLALGLLWPTDGRAQRFGGYYGGAGGFWLMYVAPDIPADRSFDRELGDVVTLGGRGFVQVGRVRLGGGGLGGSFTDEGLNEAGNRVSGSLSMGGFTAEYLVVQQDYEIAVGGLAGGGRFELEERLSLDGDVERLNRRSEGIFVGVPWVRVAYNPAPFVNAGLQVGYVVGSEGFDGFAIGLDIVAGLIP